MPIALGIVAASGQRVLPGLEKYLIMGELGLDGSVRYLRGALPMADLAVRSGKDGCIFPASSAREAAGGGGINVFGVNNFYQVLRILSEEEDCSDLLRENLPERRPEGEDIQGEVMDLSSIKGQRMAKRGLEIAASGGHNMIMVGPPGSGKSSLAKALAGILPPMDRQESLVTSKIYSVSGIGWKGDGLMVERPFRSPHVSASLAAILGGGTGGSILPGEVSLATNGVLFLDEFCEAPKQVLESLRAPLEDRKVVISRLRSKVEFPSSFILVAASNPCPCGYYGEGNRCTCTPGRRAAYLSRLSGPLMDRIDLQVRVSNVSSDELMGPSEAESSSVVAARVLSVREVQRERFSALPISVNAEMDSAVMERFCPLSAECRGFLKEVFDSLGLSARAYTRIIKISRTIADMDGASDIEPRHIAEAVSFRFLDRRSIDF